MQNQSVNRRVVMKASGYYALCEDPNDPHHNFRMALFAVCWCEANGGFRQAAYRFQNGVLEPEKRDKGTDYIVVDFPDGIRELKEEFSQLEDLEELLTVFKGDLPTQVVIRSKDA